MIAYVNRCVRILPMYIPFHRPYMTEDEVNAASDSIRNGWLTMGKKTVEFEQMFARKIGSSDAVAVNSCTAALHLALCGIDLKAGDEVIIPTTTFVATSEVVRYFGATSVFVDIEKNTHLMDVTKIEKAITPRTKAIIPVHYSGQPADLDEIHTIAKKYKLFVIEDAAHAFPAEYKGNQIGTISDITCFSFYATKTLAAGEGGMITSRIPEVIEKVKYLRIHGVTKDAWKRYTKEGSWEYDVAYDGYKYNTTDICSSIAIEQLKKADMMNDMRNSIAMKYNDLFKNNDLLIPYVIKSDRKSARHLYPIRFNIDAMTIDRNECIRLLNEKGIGTSVHFIPLYRFSLYKSLGYKADDYPNSEWVFNRVVSIPIYPGMTDNEIDMVSSSVLDICEKYRR